MIVRPQRTRKDWALAVRELVDRHDPHAPLVRLVSDNRNTHNGASLYAAFALQEAPCILACLEFHPTPKHASWLNTAEIEINVMNRQCLDRRMPDVELVTQEIASWKADRNQQQVQLYGTFTIAAARV